MPRVVVRDLELYWEKHGRGEAVLLISGVGGGTWTWEEAMSTLSSCFTLIIFDNLGAGRSSAPDRPYRIDEMADHAAVVLDAAEEIRAHVVGFSMGGMIAQELALRHPDRVSSLVLGCTHCGVSERIPPNPEVIRKFTDNQGLSPEEIIDKDISLLVSQEFLQNAPEILHRYKARQLKAPLQPHYALQRQLEAIRAFDACGRIHKIQTPTLIITGEMDTLVPPQNGHLLATRIPGAIEKSFAGAGHLIHLECASAFHQTVINFFRGLASVNLSPE